MGTTHGVSQLLRQVVEAGLHQELILRPREREKWNRELSDDEFSQAPGFFIEILKELGRTGREFYRRQNWKYSYDSSRYNSMIFRRVGPPPRRGMSVAHIGGGTGFGLGYAPTIWELNYSLQIWDISDVGLLNAQARIHTLEKQYLTANAKASPPGHSIHLGELAAIFDSPSHGIDHVNTGAVIVKKVLQHETNLEDMRQAARSIGSFLKDPTKFAIFGHPFGDDPVNRDFPWTRSVPYLRREIQQFLSEGAGRLIEILWEQPCRYFYQNYTFFTARAIQ